MEMEAGRAPRHDDARDVDFIIIALARKRRFELVAYKSVTLGITLQPIIGTPKIPLLKISGPR